MNVAMKRMRDGTGPPATRALMPEARTAGFKIHLDKPFTPQKLLEAIQSILKD